MTGNHNHSSEPFDAVKFLAFNLSLQGDGEAEEEISKAELIEAIGGKVESYKLGIKLGRRVLDALAQGQPPKHSPVFPTSEEHEVLDGFLEAVEIGGIHKLNEIPLVEEQGFQVRLVELMTPEERTPREVDFGLSIPAVRVIFIPPGQLFSPAE